MLRSEFLAAAAATLAPGTLRVASAYPDPPFEHLAGGEPAGFDVDLIRAVARRLGLRPVLQRYRGADFNGIFAGLGTRYDVVISGTTVTPSREKVARFSRPYAVFDQGVAVDRARTPGTSVAALRGATVGIQRGNTSEIPARRWLARGEIARIRWYAYDAIESALDDLERGTIAAVVKLDPVLRALIAARPRLGIAFRVPTHERIAIATALGDAPLARRIDDALAALEADGTLPRLRARWFSAS